MTRSYRAAAAAAALLLAPLLLLLPHWAAAATDAERRALLDFKAAITADPTGVLATWTPSGDPCAFVGVTCGPSSGAVQRLRIHGAGLAGALAPSLARLPALESISLFGNRLEGGVPPSLAPTLRKLNLSRNALAGEIPPFLGAFPWLRLLDLSYNAFAGEIPAALFDPCLRLRYVSLAHNNLTGPVPPGIAKCSRLAGFDFSYNRLSGELPDQVCAPPEMNYISVRSNSLSGDLAAKLTSCSSIDLFDVGSNRFSGAAPFALLGTVNITYFNVSSNAFDGEIPSITTCGSKFSYFDASGNRLTGPVPESVVNCRNLRVLDLGANALAGVVPPVIGTLRSLSVLRLAGNAGISGSIPAELGGIEMLVTLDLAGLALTGEIPGSLSQCQFLLELNLSGNKLQGAMPSTLNNLTYLKMLDLHRNQLDGVIPVTLGQLTNLVLLDLSENQLTGSIPQELGNLSNLTHFNVSFNNLSGMIPLVPVVQKFDFTAFMDNPLLCGPPLNNLCGGQGHRKRLGVPIIIAIVAAALILIGICIVCALNIKAYTCKSRDEEDRKEEEEVLVSESTTIASPGSNAIIGKLVLFSKSLPSRYEDWETGTKALLDKDCLIGGGSIGTVYKATFENGLSIAVKKLETLGRVRDQDEFEHEMSQPGNLSHPNLVAFQGYYWSSSMQLLLSEFMANGSLYDHLHGNHPYGFSESSSRGGGGKKPVDSPGMATAVVLHDYVREILEDGTASDCFDRNLRGFVEAELVQVLKLGLVCTSNTPSSRPSMAEVVQFLESVRTSS
ncbi:putative LRR receptor-like serine/threonine-protein kinase [Panicum miliaceum]|uniref:LRR receptor-like serine/threonine-protein kinase n=1 Tax=Panicum miliaceum TaxID=4540 RepID=A0A3L6S938_PANMI|nr:putative LRR receptor-like serine/threonine-protein kinase [Panicum miliaceum]